MGFDVNFNNKPMIQETQSMHDGGAGNLGYFEQEENKKKKKSEKSIFSEAKESEDTFEKDGLNSENGSEFSISRFIAQIILNVKDWYKKTFGKI